jgi:formate/nitrite transporter FocA (FNT family)
MSTSAGMNAARYNLLLIVLFIIYIFAHCGRSHFVMNFVSVKFLLLLFWIKLLVKMANFPTFSRL